MLDWTVLSWNFFKTFLEGSVDHIIYRDYRKGTETFGFTSTETIKAY